MRRLSKILGGDYGCGMSMGGLCGALHAGGCQGVYLCVSVCVCLWVGCVEPYTLGVAKVCVCVCVCV